MATDASPLDHSSQPSSLQKLSRSPRSPSASWSVAEEPRCAARSPATPFSLEHYVYRFFFRPHACSAQSLSSSLGAFPTSECWRSVFDNFPFSREAKQLGGTSDPSPLSNVAQARLPLANDASLSSNFYHLYQLQ
ncbi:jg22939 [Pararge aegeria aegeria]|uniref:Jg22939 protein n=1 Tax=Pararge aegeria aegeria TaxID=348720 RepID=A0A8S4QYC1_9NEOP|nr:jg22939 [Pararge aegeria aegeria]